jgi:hypothetical protein
MTPVVICVWAQTLEAAKMAASRHRPHLLTVDEKGCRKVPRIVFSYSAFAQVDFGLRFEAWSRRNENRQSFAVFRLAPDFTKKRRVRGIMYPGKKNGLQANL